MSAAAALPAVGYVRVSTGEQELDAQKAAIAAEAAARGIKIDLRGEKISTRRKQRPVFDQVLEQLDAGEYSMLIVARLDRAFRSLGHFAETLDRSKRKGWELVLLHPRVDTTDMYGRAMAGVAAIFAELERDLISQRTKEAMAEKKRSGTYKAPPGRRRTVCDEAVRYVRRHAGKKSQAEIAEDLTTLEIPAPTARGWSQQAVSRVIARYCRS